MVLGSWLISIVINVTGAFIIVSTPQQWKSQEKLFSEAVKMVPLASIATSLILLLIWKLSFLQCNTVEGLGVLPHNDRRANIAQK